MANTKAQAEKEKGNVAFKVGDYPTAIGHYSAALHADETDYTFSLNRAAAYLKLGKNEDAERDCTNALSLCAYNAKALFRRGQARVAMGKYDEGLDDYMLALRREPNNELVKDEILTTNNLISAKKKELKPKSTQSEPLPSKRRRVPIKIISPETTAAPPKAPTTEPTTSYFSDKKVAALAKKYSGEKAAATETSEADMTPVSTRSLKSGKGKQPDAALRSSSKQETHLTRQTTPAQSFKPESKPYPGPYASWRTNSGNELKPSKTEKNRTFIEAKAARDSRVGGGIFRASGASTVFPRSSSASGFSETTPDSYANADVKLAAPISNAPMTLFDFSRAWGKETSTKARWELLQTVLPSSLPMLFRTSLEPELLSSIINVFGVALGANPQPKVAVREYMDAFPKVARFGTVVLFLSQDEKAQARMVWESLGVTSENESVRSEWKPIWA